MTTYELPELGIPARRSTDGATVEVGHVKLAIKDVPILLEYYGTRLAEVVRAGELIDSEEEAKKKSAEDARVEEAAKVFYKGYFGSETDRSWGKLRRGVAAILKAIDAGLV